MEFHNLLLKNELLHHVNNIIIKSIMMVGVKNVDTVTIDDLVL